MKALCSTGHDWYKLRVPHPGRWNKGGVPLLPRPGRIVQCQDVENAASEEMRRIVWNSRNLYSFQLLPCPFWQKPAGRVGFPASKFHVRQTSCISTSSTFVGLIFICLNSIFQCQLAQNYHFGLLYPCAKKPLFTDIAESILWGAICKEHRSRELLQDSKRSLYTDPRVRISYKDSAWGRLNTP